MLNQCHTIKDVLMLQQLPMLERRMLLEYVFDKPRAWFITHDDHVLDQAEKERLQALFERRLAGEPMAYIVGRREFMGLNFKVSPAVLIPRPETELLVETALDFLERLKEKGVKQPRVLDIGTGSGIIAISIKHYFPAAEVVALDLSAEALEIAQENARNLKVEVEWLQSDLFSALKPTVDQFDLILSNPPYIHKEDEHLGQGDVRFEPEMALTDYADGLTLIRRLIAEAPHYLKRSDQAALWMEHGWDQAVAIRECLEKHAFQEVGSLKDLAGIERISGGLL